MAGYCYQILTNQRRAMAGYCYQILTNQSLPPMRGTDGIKGTVPSFPSITQSRNDVDSCVNTVRSLAKTRQYHPESRTRVTISEAATRGVFNSGATYRLELQCYHLAGKSERNNNSHNNIRYACTCLSPLRRSIPVLFRFAPAFGQPR